MKNKKKGGKEVLYIVILCLAVLLAYTLKELYITSKKYNNNVQSTQLDRVKNIVSKEDYVKLESKVRRGSKVPYLEGYYCPKDSFNTKDYLYFPQYDYKNNQGYFYNSVKKRSFVTYYEITDSGFIIKCPEAEYTNEAKIITKTAENLIIDYKTSGSTGVRYTRFCSPGFLDEVPKVAPRKNEVKKAPAPPVRIVDPDPFPKTK